MCGAYGIIECVAGYGSTISYGASYGVMFSIGTICTTTDDTILSGQALRKVRNFTTNRKTPQAIFPESAVRVLGTRVDKHTRIVTIIVTEIYILFARTLQFEVVMSSRSTWEPQNWNQLPPCQSGT
eukprot:1186912-Prorocentrum_minimum.AAC.1